MGICLGVGGVPSWVEDPLEEGNGMHLSIESPWTELEQSVVHGMREVGLDCETSHRLSLSDFVLVYAFNISHIGRACYVQCRKKQVSADEIVKNDSS